MNAMSTLKKVFDIADIMNAIGNKAYNDEYIVDNLLPTYFPQRLHTLHTLPGKYKTYTKILH